MTAGEQLYQAMGQKHKELGRRLTPEEWAKVADDFMASKTKMPPRRKNVTGAGMSDEEWFAQLAKDPAMDGVDVKAQATKCRLWTQTKFGEPPSRMRILNWLLKCDRTLPANGSPRIKDGLSPYTEPQSEWRGVAQGLIPQDCTMAENIRDGIGWHYLPMDFRLKIVRAM